MGLELYAKIEPLLGFGEQKRYLHDLFVQKLAALGVESCLDVGCGSGDFMALAKERGIRCVGIDLSEEMVQRARSAGLEAYRKDLCEIEGKFDAVTAVFDVINYLDKESLKSFFACAKGVLRDGGYFICDMNSLYGFEEVAQGALIVDSGEEFVTIDADFDDNVLKTKINHFAMQEDGCYIREQDEIVQYYHDIEYLKSLGLELVDLDFVSLFGEEVDKVVMTFKRK